VSKELIENLRLKLNVPKKSRTNEWFDEVGKSVNLLYIDFLNHESDEIAIHSLVLIRLAAKEGSKDAKNKVIKLTRWVNKAPPSVTKCIFSKDEEKLIIKDFSVLKSEWVRDYIFEELKHCSKIQVNDYLEWLFKYSNNTNKLIEVINFEFKKHKEEITKEKELLILDFLLKKNLMLMERYSEKDLIHMTQFFEEILIKQKSIKDKEAVAIKLYEIIKNLIYVHPVILLENSFFSLLERVRSNVDSTSSKVNTAFNQIAIRIAELINYGVIVSKDNFYEMNAYYLKYLTKYAPKFQEILKQKNLTSLNNINLKNQNVEIIKHDNVDNVFISFYASWREIKNSGINDKSIENIEKYITELAQIHSIIKVGEIGQEYNYDPLKHQLIQDGNEDVQSVRIKIPGIGKIREDGSIRVISKAITERC
jgi:hypothetical protein